MGFSVTQSMVPVVNRAWEIDIWSAWALGTWLAMPQCTCMCVSIFLPWICQAHLSPRDEHKEAFDTGFDYVELQVELHFRHQWDLAGNPASSLASRDPPVPIYQL